MIAFLNGELVSAEPGVAVVDVGGIGYRVLIPSSTLSRLPSVGEKVKLFTRLVVKEDEMHLYGFSSQEELSIFLHLVSVSGVGPKGAMNILSSFTPVTFRGAVAEENVTLLAKAPGVGKKTARRIILELKDKLGPVPPAVVKQQVTGSLNGGEEAVTALISLGYRQSEARSAVAKAMEQKGRELGLEELVKYSLRILDKV